MSGCCLAAVIGYLWKWKSWWRFIQVPRGLVELLIFGKALVEFLKMFVCYCLFNRLGPKHGLHQDHHCHRCSFLLSKTELSSFCSFICFLALLADLGGEQSFSRVSGFVFLFLGDGTFGDTTFSSVRIGFLVLL